jgi:hypothetical protein
MHGRAETGGAAADEVKPGRFRTIDRHFARRSTTSLEQELGTLHNF